MTKEVFHKLVLYAKNTETTTMQKVLIVLALIICCLTQSCNSQTGDNSKDDGEQVNKHAPFYSKQLPTGSPRISKQYDSTKIENYDPFLIYKDGSYMIAAEIESKELLDKYNPILNFFC